MNRAIHECTDIKNGDMLETKFGFDQILLDWKTLRIFYFGYLTDEKSSWKKSERHTRKTWWSRRHGETAHVG